MNVGKMIREARESLGLTQTDIARKIGVSTMFISHIEAGIAGVPKLRIEAMAKAVGLPKDELQDAIILEMTSDFRKDSK